MVKRTAWNVLAKKCWMLRNCMDEWYKRQTDCYYTVVIVLRMNYTVFFKEHGRNDAEQLFRWVRICIVNDTQPYIVILVLVQCQKNSDTKPLKF